MRSHYLPYNCLRQRGRLLKQFVVDVFIYTPFTFLCFLFLSQSSSDLACFVRFEQVNVYMTDSYRLKYKAPTDFCFVLKVSTEYSPWNEAVGGWKRRRGGSGQMWSGKVWLDGVWDAVVAVYHAPDSLTQASGESGTRCTAGVGGHRDVCFRSKSYFCPGKFKSRSMWS